MSEWTEERIATLKRMVGERYSFGRIAEVLGGVSRNACIGKAKRLGVVSQNPMPMPLISACFSIRKSKALWSAVISFDAVFAGKRLILFSFGVISFGAITRLLRESGGEDSTLWNPDVSREGVRYPQYVVCEVYIRPEPARYLGGANDADFSPHCNAATQAPACCYG